MPGSNFRDQVDGGAVLDTQVDLATGPAVFTNCIGRTGTLGSCTVEKTIVVAGSMFLGLTGVGVALQGRISDQSGNQGTLGQCFYSVGGSTNHPTSADGSQGTGTLGSCTYSTGVTKTTDQSGNQGTLGFCFYNVGGSIARFTSGDGSAGSGTLGFCSATKQVAYDQSGNTGALGEPMVYTRSGGTTIGSIDIEQIANMIIERDPLGNPITLRQSLRLHNAVAAALSSGFPDQVIKVFKALSQNKDRIRVKTDEFGNRRWIEIDLVDPGDF